jgi:hypothetical protein
MTNKQTFFVWFSLVKQISNRAGAVRGSCNRKVFTIYYKQGKSPMEAVEYHRRIK